MSFRSNRIGSSQVAEKGFVFDESSNVPACKMSCILGYVRQPSSRADKKSLFEYVSLPTSTRFIIELNNKVTRFLLYTPKQCAYRPFPLLPTYGIFWMKKKRINRMRVNFSMWKSCYVARSGWIGFYFRRVFFSFTKSSTFSRTVNVLQKYDFANWNISSSNCKLLGDSWRFIQSVDKEHLHLQKKNCARHYKWNIICNSDIGAMNNCHAHALTHTQHILSNTQTSI